MRAKEKPGHRSTAGLSEQLKVVGGYDLPLRRDCACALRLASGLFVLFLPPGMEAELFLRQLHYQDLFYLYGCISLGLGGYLTYGGFKSTPTSSFEPDK